MVLERVRLLLDCQGGYQSVLRCFKVEDIDNSGCSYDDFRLFFACSESFVETTAAVNKIRSSYSQYWPLIYILYNAHIQSKF